MTAAVVLGEAVPTSVLVRLPWVRLTTWTREPVAGPPVDL